MPPSPKIIFEINKIIYCSIFQEEDGPLIEADFTEEPGNDSGCTAVLALIAGTRLYVANAGDSRYTTNNC